MPCVHERDVSIEIVQYTRSGVQPAGTTVLHSVTLHAVGSSVRLSVGRESIIQCPTGFACSTLHCRFSFLLFVARCYASAAYAVMCCLSVRPFVCPSHSWIRSGVIVSSIFLSRVSILTRDIYSKSVRPSVRPPVCPSVTLRYCMKTA